MYGSEETDIVVKYYDDSFAIGDKAEIGWYLSKVKAFGGPILDLACGTGRVALLLAKEGYDVTAIDQSSGMLNQFKKKVELEAPEVRGRIQMAEQRMSNFSLPSKFNTIICCDAFFHNHLTPAIFSFLYNYHDNASTKTKNVACVHQTGFLYRLVSVRWVDMSLPNSANRNWSLDVCP